MRSLQGGRLQKQTAPKNRRLRIRGRARKRNLENVIESADDRSEKPKDAVNHNRRLRAF